MQPTKNYNSHCFGNNVIVTFQSYTVILIGYLFAVSLISHWSLPPFFHVCWCEARGNFMVACGSHHFLSALIIPLFAFVINLVLHLFTFYSFLAFCCWAEKEPLPQVVEVLLHAAARAATFLIFDSHVDCDLNPKRVAFEK